MRNMECIEDLLNAVMTFYSVAVIEHYMIFLLIIRARSVNDVHDQLLNAVRDHLDKEDRMLDNMLRLKDCVDGNTSLLLNGFIKNVKDGIALVNDPEFISNYINDPETAIKTLIKYMLYHEELLSSIINALRENIRKFMNNLA